MGGSGSEDEEGTTVNPREEQVGMMPVSRLVVYNCSRVASH